MVRIIGIDPGLRNTGWGIIEQDGQRLSYVADGSLHSKADGALAERLLQLHGQLVQVLRDFVPDEAAVEETFVNTDARATLKLGQARGVLLLAPASLAIPVAEYAPNTIKKSVVGAGHADKDQVKHMVKLLLPRAAMKTADSVDALAIAICHAHHRGPQALARLEARS
jgi:crossover junction endodeoxyribonuclease RuvC